MLELYISWKTRVKLIFPKDTIASVNVVCILTAEKQKAPPKWGHKNPLPEVVAEEETRGTAVPRRAFLSLVGVLSAQCLSLKWEPGWNRTTKYGV